MSHIKSSLFKFAFSIVALAFLLLSSGGAANAQTSEIAKTDQSVGQAEDSSGSNDARQSAGEPVYSEYRGIKIGMTADEVRNAVNHLKEKGDAQDFFVFSGNETAQVFYDKDRRVMAVSIDYLGKASGAPTPEQVLGRTIQPKDDGSMYSRLRYEDAGYWVSYNRTAGDNPTVTITMQKI